MGNITVRDAAQLLKKHGARLENNNDGLDKPLNNITFFVHGNSDKDMLTGREMIIIPYNRTYQSEDYSSFLMGLLNYLVKSDIAALLIYRNVGGDFTLSPEVIDYSNTLKIPLLSIGNNISYTTVVSEIYMTIFDSESFDWNSYSKIISEFSGILLSPKATFDMVSDKLAELVQQNVVIFDSYGFVITHSANKDNSLLTLSEMHDLFAIISKSFSKDSPDEMIQKQITIGERQYLCTLYRTQFKSSLFYVALVNNNFNCATKPHFIHTALFQATRAIALIKNRDSQQYQIKERKLTDFYDTLFYNRNFTEQQLKIKAASCGIDIHGKHQAVKILPDIVPEADDDDKINETLTHIIASILRSHFRKVFIITIEGGFAAFLQYHDDYSAAEHKKKIINALSQVEKALTSSHSVTSVRFGVGKEQDSIFLLQESLRQANDAIKLGGKIACKDDICFWGEMGIYSLLTADSMELFYNMSHNALASISHILGKNSERILDTLENYFDTNCSLLKTAQIMDLHVNTIKYRIAKAKSLLNESMFEGGEEQLLLHLLLKMRHLF